MLPQVGHMSKKLLKSSVEFASFSLIQSSTFSFFVIYIVNVCRSCAAVVAEPRLMAAQVFDEHRGFGKVLFGPNNCAVRSRNMGYRTQLGQTACTVRKSTERARGNRSNRKVKILVALAFQRSRSFVNY